jgi:hypothetical protein
VLLSDNGRVTTKELPPEVVYRTEKPLVNVSYSGTQTVPAQPFKTFLQPTFAMSSVSRS